jgi:hypothetical protein
MTDSAGKKAARINIELPADLEAIYANITLISHSPSEIILDFARILPNTPTAKIYGRVIMTPMNAKLLYQALGENLAKFEEKYGAIPAPDQNVMLDRDRGFTK